jgi:hypothetical protein
VVRFVDRRSQRFAQGRIAVLDAAEVAVPWPCPKVRCRTHRFASNA